MQSPGHGSARHYSLGSYMHGTYPAKPFVHTIRPPCARRPGRKRDRSFDVPKDFTCAALSSDGPFDGGDGGHG